MARLLNYEIVDRNGDAALHDPGVAEANPVFLGEFGLDTALDQERRKIEGASVSKEADIDPCPKNDKKNCCPNIGTTEMLRDAIRSTLTGCGAVLRLLGERL